MLTHPLISVYVTDTHQHFGSWIMDAGEAVKGRHRAIRTTYALSRPAVRWTRWIFDAVIHQLVGARQLKLDQRDCSSCFSMISCQLPVRPSEMLHLGNNHKTYGGRMLSLGHSFAAYQQKEAGNQMYNKMSTDFLAQHQPMPPKCGCHDVLMTSAECGNKLASIQHNA